MRMRFDPNTPFYLWTVASGFAFYETETSRDAAAAALPAGTVQQVGTLPAEEVGRPPPQPDPHNLLAACVIATIPGPVFAALWNCSGQNDIRWYLTGCVMLHGCDAYATDGMSMVRKADAATWLTTDQPPRFLVHLDAWVIPLLREKTVVEVLATGIVRVTRRLKRGDEVIAMGSQIARGPAIDADPLPAPWLTIETMFADMFNAATVEGLHTPVSAYLLARAVAPTGHSRAAAAAVVFRSNPEPTKAVAWVGSCGTTGVIMPMRFTGDMAAHFERYGLKAPEPVPADERAELAGEG